MVNLNNANNDFKPLSKPKDFIDEVRDSIDPRPHIFVPQFLASDLADIEQIEEKRQMEAAIGRRLMEATNQLNLALDDFRGRHKELRHLEESIQPKRLRNFVNFCEL